MGIVELSFGHEDGFFLGLVAAAVPEHPDSGFFSGN
jgi:hypothetical protein